MVDKFNTVTFNSSNIKVKNTSNILKVELNDNVFYLEIKKTDLTSHQLYATNMNTKNVYISAPITNTTVKLQENQSFEDYLSDLFQSTNSLLYNFNNNNEVLVIKFNFNNEEIVYTCSQNYTASSNFDNQNNVKDSSINRSNNTNTNSTVTPEGFKSSGNSNLDNIMYLIHDCKFDLALSEAKSLISNPEYEIKALELQAEINNYLRNNKEVFTICDSILQKDKNNHKALAEKSLAYRALFKYPEASDLIEQALKLHNQDSRYFYIKAFIYNCKGRNFNNKALEAIQEGYKVNSQDSELIGLHGLILSEQGKLQEAIEKFDIAIKLRPNNFYHWVHKGLSYKNNKKPEDAKDCFIKALEMNPNCSIAYDNLGEIYMNNLKDNVLAKKNFEQSVSADPNNTHALVNLSKVCYKLGEKSDAMKYAKKSVEIQPEYSFGYHQIGNIYYNSNDFDNATDYFQKAVDIKPDHVGFLNSLGNSQFENNQFMEAVETFELVLDIDPNNENANDGKEQALQRI